ncbi:EamA family transporter [Methylobrevis albus]|uniref:EamA family transporter n=1 Tax=Methylobrevis albus TaxID=2793297 RepID=A0A931I4C1_9HYPH|nr:DMT family transporter [Methylobrevis albus]MBH0239043.1 EamA family transporter [Methylobrevis albus]
MTPAVIGLALFAAVLHATWNAFLRTGADRLWTITVMSQAMGLSALPFALLLPAPDPAAWPFIALSALLQVGYSVFLVAAYRHGELGQVYPIARGSVPLMVTAGSFVFAGERLEAVPLLGVALVAAGIMSLALGKTRASTASILYALLTGLFIAGYSTSDAIGVRLTPDPNAYVAWLFVLYGVLLTATYVAMRRGFAIDFSSRATWTAIFGGVLSLLAYGAVVFAYALGPVGPVSALRETSVVFAALIGWLFLGEGISLRRILACVVVAAGAILISYH